MDNIILRGNNIFAYRDPACCYINGTYYLFYTVAEKENGYMYERIGMIKSNDLKSWSSQIIITPKDLEKNYCSPGNILKYNDEYILCFSSYPMREKYEKSWAADESARLYIMRTKDFSAFSEPEVIKAKGNTEVADLGRMIDPFICEDKNEKGKYWIFYKQNGVSMSYSYDLTNWTYYDKIDGGENVCILDVSDGYLMLDSPDNGFNIRTSENLVNWKLKGTAFKENTEWEWANGRLTAPFAMITHGDCQYKYIMFFHGSRREAFPETHGNASIAFLYTDDFINYADADGKIYNRVFKKSIN